MYWQQFCSAKIVTTTTTPGIYVTELWKVTPCSATAPVLVATATDTFSAPFPTTAVAQCKDFVLTAVPADLNMAAGDQIIVTQRYNFAVIFSVVNNVSITFVQIPA